MNQYNDLEKQLAELQAREHAIRQLVASAGWKEVVTHCEGAITTRRQGAFATMGQLRGFEDVFNLARLGSEVAGLQYVLQLPYVVLRDLEVDIKNVIIARREMEDNGTT